MKSKGPFHPQALLWWISIISLAVSAAVFFLLGEQAEFDVHARQQRMLFPMAGVIIAGVCLIAGTSGRWFQSK